MIDVAARPLHVLVKRIREEAAARCVQVVRGELVGLVPARVVQRAAGLPAEALPDAAALSAAARVLALDELAADAVLELRLRAAGLLRLA